MGLASHESHPPHRTATGRFVLRIPAPLHGLLRETAREAGLSLNEYCTRRLGAPGSALGAEADAAVAVAAAATLLGRDLVGVLAFGSWARGELAAGSDVDLLVAAEPGVELTRELYRRWDATPLRWGGRPVDPHFVHLPAPELRVAGVWAEAAIEGVVLFERDFRLSSRLVQIRRDIAAGRIVRRLAHGQPYWTEVA